MQLSCSLGVFQVIDHYFSEAKIRSEMRLKKDFHCFYSVLKIFSLEHSDTEG